MVAERVSDGQRFSVRRWQYEMLRRFDGGRTFEQSAREVHSLVGGGFTAVGLLNFYRWLYQENLVLCECDSIFELVQEEEEIASGLELLAAREPESRESTAEETAPKKTVAFRVGEWIDGIGPMQEWQKTALKVSAVVVFGLAVIRLAFVAAPALEIPVGQVFAGIESYFLSDPVAGQSERESARQVEASRPRQMELAGRVEQPSGLPLQEAADPAVDGVVSGMEIIEQLRQKMSECRIRRDEFYIQNNEEGYRREVEKMTELAREIGEIEASL